MAFCTGCGGALAAGRAFCPSCGKSVTGAVAAPQGDATGGVIPYKNVPALVGYYLGVFSLIPCFPIGIAAFVLGIIGYRRYRANPVIKGAVHAWVGIIAGGLFGLLWLASTVLSVVAAAHGK